MSKGLVVVAMSGGVDSSVTALLLKEAGYSVIGVTMRLWTPPLGDALTYQRGCCSLEDVDDARRVCQIIGAPHYFLNFEREFRESVVDYFCQEYTRGRTPNPCIACNHSLKFDLLLKRAEQLGADFIATGHYARVVRRKGSWRLLKALDPSKDQSYVLFSLTQAKLQRVLFPMGWYAKTEARRIAQDASLPVAQKPDSQEICFIPGADYRSFLAERAAHCPGEIVDRQGNVLGNHQGVAFFTVGQRRGLGIASERPLYVLELDAARNRIVVGAENELAQHTLQAEETNYVAGVAPTGPTPVTAKIRYRAPEAPGILTPQDNGMAVLDFQEPQRAITPGQAVVFYQGDEVLGGGYIRTVGASKAPAPDASTAMATVY